jgi:glycine/D-amino acid oxidase-like deaminating enzyme
MSAAPSPSPSPWLEACPPAEPAPVLEGEQQADVAVVGAGLTGLGAALALRAEGLSVSVLERETAGFGASGRNAGHLTPTIGKDLPTLLAVYGRERARSLVGLAHTAVQHVERWIEKLGIACEYEPVGNVMAAVHASQERRLERAARVASELGAHATWLPREQMRGRGLPEAFRPAHEAAGGSSSWRSTRPGWRARRAPRARCSTSAAPSSPSKRGRARRS